MDVVVEYDIPVFQISQHDLLHVMLPAVGVSFCRFFRCRQPCSKSSLHLGKTVGGTRGYLVSSGSLVIVAGTKVGMKGSDDMVKKTTGNK